MDFTFCIHRYPFGVHPLGQLFIGLRMKVMAQVQKFLFQW
jgi:hypothetical protein